MTESGLTVQKWTDRSGRKLWMAQVGEIYGVGATRPKAMEDLLNALSLMLRYQSGSLDLPSGTSSPVHATVRYEAAESVAGPTWQATPWEPEPVTDWLPS